MHAIAALALPSAGWCLVTDPIPFYYFDGASYTAVFTLPDTYFVLLEEEGAEFDRVSYLDLSGYIRHGAALSVDYEPASKYPTSGSVTLKKSISSVWLYADAAMSSVIGEVTAADQVFLYGDAVGSDAVYVRAGSSESYVRGYLSVESVDISYPPENDTSAIADDDPAEDDPSPQPSADDDAPSSLSAVVQIILVVSLSLPAFLLVFLLSAKK